MNLQELQNKFQDISNALNIESIKEKEIEIANQLKDPNNWEDQSLLNKLNISLKAYQKQLLNLQGIQDGLDYIQAFHEEISEKEIQDSLEALNKKINDLEVKTLLNQKHDSFSAILSVYSGAGGDDAEDFTQMIYNMYQKYSENQEYQTSILECSLTESGIKHISIKIEGPYAYGNLKSEHGVHRLVRLSPFNSGNTRETSFCLVDVIPIIETDNSIKLEPQDLRIDTFKSQGPGGQSVNTTDSAVRVTHIPTKISASCQSERSQHQNKENALNLLKSKLTHLLEIQNKKEIQDIRGENLQNSFGSQIRSYTLHPYKLVKDHRTSHEDNNPENVLNGKIDGFIYSYLKENV
ncbi:peptide chain release factor 2 [bacterium]|jgi:peptide chain release factor 2|nr:peptide chain release factor 2 [bacterium]MBT6293569.1 peptide chain release factor 2 [bacterium]